jgi:hypothetical protein
LLCRQRKIRFQAALNHRLMRDGGQSGTVSGFALENWFGLVARVSRGSAGGFHKIKIFSFTAANTAGLKEWFLRRFN